MRRLSLCLLLAACTTSLRAQLKIDNAVFFIGSGATVTVQGDVTSNVSIQGTGLLQLKGSSLQNVDMGGNTIPNLELDNAAHATLINTNARVGSSMTITNGRFRLGNFNLSLDPAVTAITGVNSTRFIETNGTGVLTKENLGATPFVFPVGFSGAEFNPLSIANTGTIDNISVRAMQNVLLNGISGAPVSSDFANNSWVVSEAVVGGSNLNMVAEWSASDELAGFNRVKSGIARFNTGTDWDLPASNVLAASGGGPYSRTRNNVNSVGVFAVADLEKVNAALLNLRVRLQGAYNPGNGLMNDGLRVAGVIPTTQPYSSSMSSRFNRMGVYDGSVTVNESVPSTAVFDVATAADDIVDWVYVSLQDGTTPATKLQTRAALLQRDGDIVEYDVASGTYVPLRMPIDADGNYHLVIGHRNHLSVRTPVSQLLQDNAVFSHDFSTGQSKAFQDGAIINNAAMASIPGTFPTFALWGGNVNANTNVRFSGPQNDNLALLTLLGGNTSISVGPVYSLGDVNLNGTMRFSGPQNDNLAMLAVLVGNTSIVYTEHQ